MSSVYRVLKPYFVFDATVADSTKYSEITDVSGLLVVEYDINWSGGSSLNGAITLESLLYKPTDDATTWVWQTLDLGSAVTLTGTSGSHTIILNSVPMTQLRLKYTSTAGTAVLNATIKGKGW